ncbi:MAG: hypothetical protein ABIK07_17935, partial [Planctomycetota bacterium]|jgi:hypothetical protein|uniref:hypothetical protein n=1 Tax=uncultured Gimesia sp. TaxID=1678688 RepID=UPI00260AD885|nr:hypothetical protein [uncultured Gimesia sp.]
MNHSDLPNSQAEKTEAPEMRPTYAPAALAMGITFMFWGILTHWSMSLIGIAVIVYAIWSWMNEIRSAWSETK